MSQDPFSNKTGLRQVLRFPLYIAAVAILCWTLLRVVLWGRFLPEESVPGDMGRVFLTGLHADVVWGFCGVSVLVGLCSLLTWLVGLPLWGLLRLKWQARLHTLLSVLFRIAVATGVFIGVFLLVSEYYFFEEFSQRFNTVALDYITYVHEVTGNIRESYPLPAILSGVGGITALILWVGFRYFPPVWHAATAGTRWLAVAVWLALSAGGLLSIWPDPVRFQGHPVVKALANNGWHTALRAGLTRNLDYSLNYAVVDRAEAFRTARRILEEPGVVFAGPPVGDAPPLQLGVNPADDPGQAAWLDSARASLQRRIPGDPARPRLNVCVVVEESLGSEFWGSLGRTSKKGKPETFTRRMDAIATGESLLFTNMLADGNRTIRGLEAIFSSFPPLPGDSILARDRTDGVETLATVLKRDGYNTLFLYGGRGTFDFITRYTLPNGWDRLIEEKDFINPVHTSAFGVSDEDLLQRGVLEMRALHEKGQPFLTSFMTVSNHLPFTFPEGRIKEKSGTSGRKGAVRYTDWALGDFFKRCKKEKFWQDTIFVVVADHGARVIGSQTIPLKSYAIPLVITGPAVVKAPRQVETPGCQLDVAPTILGLIGRPYDSIFYGRDLLKDESPARSKALMHHNRSIAIYKDHRQVVLGLNQALEYWQGAPKSGAMQRYEGDDEASRKLAHDGISLFQTADELYLSRRYRVVPAPTGTPAP